MVNAEATQPVCMGSHPIAAHFFTCVCKPRTWDFNRYNKGFVHPINMYCVLSNPVFGLCTREIVRHNAGLFTGETGCTIPWSGRYTRDFLRTPPLSGPYTWEVGRTLCAQVRWCTYRKAGQPARTFSLVCPPGSAPQAAERSSSDLHGGGCRTTEQYQPVVQTMQHAKKHVVHR